VASDIWFQAEQLAFVVNMNTECHLELTASVDLLI